MKLVYIGVILGLIRIAYEGLILGDHWIYLGPGLMIVL